MYSYKVNKLPKSTVEITLKVPKEDILAEKNKAFERLQKDLTVEGFRKGKAPVEIARKQISPDSVYQEMIKVYLPKIYDEILKKENFKPVINPKLDLTKAKEGEDWKIRITITEKPIIILGRYKEAIKEIKAKEKKAEIWVPGKKGQSEAKKNMEQEKSKLMNEVLTALLNEVKVEISDLILEEELNHRLARLLDDVQKIGLTTESYLKSKNLTIDQLKDQYRKEIEDTYKLEFALSEISDKENIKVEKEDLDKLFVNIKDEKERKRAQENSYYYASVVRKQKTLDFLIGL